MNTLGLWIDEYLYERQVRMDSFRVCAPAANLSSDSYPAVFTSWDDDAARDWIAGTPTHTPNKRL